MKRIFLCIMVVVMLFSSVISVSALNNTLDYPNPDGPYQIVDRNFEWYKDARNFVLRENLMNRTITNMYFNGSAYYYGGGPYSDFEGEKSAPRSEVVKILSRYSGSYDTVYKEFYSVSTCPTFVDVPDGQQYTPAAQWAYDNGIVNGVGGAYFAPDRTITREEFAAMLYRYTNYLEVDTSARADFDSFADGDSVSAWATDAMSWAVAEGLISGKPGDLLAPRDTITRAEVAVIIYRFNNEVKAHRDIWDGSDG